ncbi:hypothetical protein MMX123_02746 [Microbacterium sp. MM2322]|uniref:hypothetical protein n=1 Tax=Microbacterium sp. MM2322 TaxID=3157631 RepID=UPI003D800244
MMMVQTNLCTTTDNKSFTRSPSYDILDPSEKVAVSYFLGMLQSHLLATKVLNYSHLVHVDRLLRAEGKSLTGSRPDFVAIDLGPNGARTNAATWEAKGRTNRFNPATLDSAKVQAQKIPALNSFKPQETIASEAYFETKTNVWSAKLKDPDWEGKELKAGLETYLVSYYQPLIAAGRQSGHLNETDLTFSYEIPGFGLTINLPTELVKAVDESAEVPFKQRESKGLVSSAARTLRERHPTSSPDLVDTDFQGDTLLSR